MLTRQVPWLRVFVEGVVIIGSILLAFAIDAWWDGRNAAAAERALLGDVIEEMEQIARVLDLADAAHEAHRVAARAILNDADQLAEREMANAIADLLSFVTLDVSTGAVDAALSTDGLGRIASDSTRMLLARWPGAFLDLAENETLELQLIEHSLHPFLRTRLSVPDLASFAGRAGVTQDPATVDLPRLIDSASLLRDLRTLGQDRELRGLVFQLLMNDSAIAQEYRELKMLVTSIIEAAEASLVR